MKAEANKQLYGVLEKQLKHNGVLEDSFLSLTRMLLDAKHEKRDVQLGDVTLKWNEITDDLLKKIDLAYLSGTPFKDAVEKVFRANVQGGWFNSLTSIPVLGSLVSAAATAVVTPAEYVEYAAMTFLG
jgi:hypothetical protein